jgi:copper chaperone CopZ
MKKSYRLKGLQCANCAAKMENSIKKIDGVNDASIDFMMQRMTIDYDEAKYQEIIKETVKIINKTEPDCTVQF